MDPYALLAGVYDEIVVDPCHARWAQYLSELWAPEEPGVRTVLDVCCGTGLMTRELALLGYRVTGVDASPAMLERARRLLGPGVELRHETLPGLTLDVPVRDLHADEDADDDDAQFDSDCGPFQFADVFHETAKVHRRNPSCTR